MINEELQNANPVVYEVKKRELVREVRAEDEMAVDEFDAWEVFGKWVIADGLYIIPR